MEQTHYPQHNTDSNTPTTTAPAGKLFARLRKLAGAAMLATGLLAAGSADAYNITGKVFLAPNGLPMSENGVINGTAVSTVMGQPLYIYVIGQDGNIITRQQVAADGTYTITGVTSGVAYAAQLSSNYYEPGGKVLFIGLPSSYYPVGEGDLPPGDLNPDYSFPLAQTSNIEVDFAFEQRPNTFNSVINAYDIVNNRLAVPASAFTANDPEDGSYAGNLAGRTVDFYPATPAASSSLYYYDTLLNFVVAGSKITIDNFNPAEVKIGVTGAPAIRGFAYSVADNAGARSYVPATIATAQPLLINLASISCGWQGEAALIRWTTATEKANDYFVIERSTDGSHFAGIGKIASKAKNGNSDAPLDYTYSDPVGGTNIRDAYYRLRSIDNSGSSTVSRIMHLRTDGSTEGTAQNWTVFPNPATDHITIVPQGKISGGVTMSLISATGAVLMTRDASGQDLSSSELSLKSLPNGQYFLQIAGSEGDAYRTQITVVR